MKAKTVAVGKLMGTAFIIVVLFHDAYGASVAATY
jgi:hypothetical protein